MTVKLTIDGRAAEVERGATILDAARKLGIEIPRLCHADGVPPAGPFDHAQGRPEDARMGGSCFLCVVRVAGRRNLVPSCVAPAEEGMDVTTRSDEIHAARKAALELLLSDHVGDCVAPCTLACPAGMDIPAMIRHIRAGDPRGALAVIRERIPFAGALGRICPRYCERVCRRADLDEPISICALKRFPADVQAMAGKPADVEMEENSKEPCEGSYKPSQGLNSQGLPSRAAPTGKRVAIIGAGPAGLSAAFYLLRNGHACVVFDAGAEPGGMFRYGVPEFRLPKRALEAEISVIRRLGAEFRMNRRLGEDLDFNALRREHDATLLTPGAALSGELNCEGAALAHSALAFLREAADFRGTGALACASTAEGGCATPTSPQTVLVLGGGNEAVAAAQTALRLGARHVTIACETAREGMPCFSEWVAEAEAEGVKLSPGVRPVRIEEAGPFDRAPALRSSAASAFADLSAEVSTKAEATADKSAGEEEQGRPEEARRSGQGRLRAVLQRGHETLCIEADRILAAPLRRVDTARFKALGLNVTGRGIAADRQTFATNLEGVFAAGEAVAGPGAGVRAVAAGRLAAAAIHRFLSGATVVAGERTVVSVGSARAPLSLMGKLSEAERSALFRDVVRAPRANPAKVIANVRKASFDEISAGLSESEAVREAWRCIQCDCLAQSTCALRRYATEYGAEPAQYRGERRTFERDASHPEIVYESGKCILCGLCVRIAEQTGERPGITFKGRGFPTVAAVPFGRTIAEGLSRAGARCAAACPTGALAIKRNASLPQKGASNGE